MGALRHGGLRRMATIGMMASLAAALLVVTDGSVASAKKASGPTVLYVGTYKGISTPAAQTYQTIQDAVNHAQKGDWILVAPGDYHENDDLTSPPTGTAITTGWYGGVDIETPDLHLRGMNRNSVIVDGTAPSAATPCSSAAGDQENPSIGRNGILVWKAAGVSIDNLTVCNFLNGTGAGSAGNEIWWNGVAGTKPGVKGYSGSYLTATSTYFAADPGSVNVCTTCALYGIFSSNAVGKASAQNSLTNLYANNFSDSGMYVGACLRKCDVTISGAWMENNALGYSGTNSGGKIVVENSKFDDNKDGFDTNTALTGDPPPPQDGRCSGGATSPVPGSNDCWVFEDNLVASNNNPNVPIAGTAGLGPTGTGMTISGGRNDIIENNEFLDNQAWGILLPPYPDGNLTNNGKTCAQEKGIDASSLGLSGLNCLFDPMNVQVLNNKFSGNGTGFGLPANPDNADVANLLAGGHEPTNCFAGNTEWDSTFTTMTGPATSANAIDGAASQTPSTCGTKTTKTGLFGANTDFTLLVQVECDAGVLSGTNCSGANYPQPTGVVMEPLPGTTLTDPAGTTLPTMPNPCLDVPNNLWCPNGSPA